MFLFQKTEFLIRDFQKEPFINKCIFYLYLLETTLTGPPSSSHSKHILNTTGTCLQYKCLYSPDINYALHCSKFKWQNKVNIASKKVKLKNKNPSLFTDCMISTTVLRQPNPFFVYHTSTFDVIHNSAYCYTFFY